VAINKTILDRLTDKTLFDTVDNHSFKKFINMRKIRAHLVNDLVNRNPSKNEKKQRKAVEFFLRNC